MKILYDSRGAVAIQHVGLRGSALLFVAVTCVLTTAILTIGCHPNGLKITRFGNLAFEGSKTCKSASVTSLPWPVGLVIKCSDGTRIDEHLMHYDVVEQSFGGPVSVISDGKSRRFETFGKAEVSIVFENKRFDSMSVYGGSTLVNKNNGKEVKLPATEARVREVFGNPTEVKYLTKPSP